MLDLRMIRQQPELVRAGLRRKGAETDDLDALLDVDESWRQALQRLEELRSERNEVSQRIGEKKRAGEDASADVIAMRAVGDEIKRLEDDVRAYEQRLNELMLRIPNLPDPDVPEGLDEADNQVVRVVGTPTAFDFEPKPHWDLGTELGILDFERAAKVSGARFSFIKGAGARLVRALTAFMMDTHAQKGYCEVLPPLLVNVDSMIGTGQLPKFADDMFQENKKNFYLIPTAEVPVTNLHREEILAREQLPIRYVAFSPCFRAEAGAAGRDTRGLIRQHQFDKVELVKFCEPDQSERELETLVADVEGVLQALELPYRVVLMCAGDTGFAARKKYDLEVWMPSYGRYVEISSCSNFGDFQARRARIRYRPQPDSKPEFVHTLNGSGVAIGRALAAVLENGQTAAGTVRIPAALQPYFGAAELTPEA